MHLGSIAAEVPVKFQTVQANLNANLVASKQYNI